MAQDHFKKYIAASDCPVNGWDGLTIIDQKIWIAAEIDRVTAQKAIEIGRDIWLTYFGIK